MSLNFIFITKNPDLATFAESCGVGRIMVDLETMGKKERQGHLNTLMSEHSIFDVHAVREVVESAELVVRVNPLHDESTREIDDVIAAGADIIMLPMIQSYEDVIEIGSIIRGRAKLLPLIETCASLECCGAISDLECVDEIHFGLNDLHLELGLTFMFELYSNGMIEAASKKLKKPFGIGGVSRCDDGIVPGRSVIAEHANLGSTGVILSRSFHGQARSVDEITENIDFQSEISALTSVYEASLMLDSKSKFETRLELYTKIESFVERH
ncbi:aldolase/citrate lyase family protein [Luminiphilus sp.]|nr:aldolase/citrate lyase family protein [Luminiphilus sp.]